MYLKSISNLLRYFVDQKLYITGCIFSIFGTSSNLKKLHWLDFSAAACISHFSPLLLWCNAAKWEKVTQMFFTFKTEFFSLISNQSKFDKAPKSRRMPCCLPNWKTKVLRLVQNANKSLQCFSLALAWDHLHSNAITNNKQKYKLITFFWGSAHFSASQRPVFPLLPTDEN